MITLNILRALPRTIPGDGLTLTRDHDALWPLIDGLPEAEKDDFCDSGIDKSIFSDQLHYIISVVPLRRDLLHQIPIVAFWIIDDPAQKIVGHITVSSAPSVQNILDIGGFILPAHRNQGYISRAYAACAAYFLNNDIASHICAYTEIPNTASMRSLLKAGFKACGRGINESDFDAETMLNRFLMTHQEPTWPYPAP